MTLQERETKTAIKKKRVTFSAAIKFIGTTFHGKLSFEQGCVRWFIRFIRNRAANEEQKFNRKGLSQIKCYVGNW